MGLAENAQSQDRSFYQLKVTGIAGEEVDLSQYSGKVALVVNTASRCGFTGQYKDLEELYQKYKERGFVVLGFPSNDFGAQEPGSNAEIKQFCELKYRTTFPIFEKGAVKGDGKQAAFKFLTEESAEEFQGDPGWNFVKFLLNKQGQVVDRFSSMTNPTGKKITARIEELLSQN